MRRLGWLLLVAPASMAAVVGAATPAAAACHAFTISSNPPSVAEGGTVTVTVTRDAGILDSRIDVTSIDESARGGDDFPAVVQTMRFTGGGTALSFPLTVGDDAAVEGTETFRLHLSNPGGCELNPNFVIGPDAVVTITDNDVAPPSAETTTGPPPSSPPTTRSTGTTLGVTTTAVTTRVSSTASTAPSSTVTTRRTTTSTSTVDVALPTVQLDDVGGDDGDGSVGAAATVAALAAVAAAAGTAHVARTTRRARAA